MLKRAGVPQQAFSPSGGLQARQPNGCQRAADGGRPYCLRPRAPGWHGMTPLALVVNTTGWQRAGKNLLRLRQR